MTHMLEALKRAALMDRDIIARLMHGFLCMTTCVTGFLVPGSISALVRVAAGPVWGEIIIAASGVIGALIMLDTYVNDVRPPDEILAWTSKYRHWLHILGGMGNFVALFTVAMAGPSTSVMLGVSFFYLGVAIFGVVIAWRDVRRRPGHALWDV